MIKSKLVTFMGAPASGKSTLASSVHTQLKINGENSIFVGEEATNFISEYGIPNTPLDQVTIFYKQTNQERMFIGAKEYIICDSSGILNYFYFRGLFQNPLQNKDIAIINHLQKEILKTLSQWDYIFYCPVRLENTEDNIRYHNIEEIKKIDRWIKSYLELENIPHIDLSNVSIEERQEYVIKTITKK